MNLGDLNKVWEIKTLKRKPKEEEARKILDKVAKQVQPIMRNHKWRVKVLSEMCPKNPSLLGLNVGAGVHVKLRLRRANRDEDFLPYEEVLDTMLHELCHNKHGPHNASFYKLWDELRKECEDLINGGISGSGQGFDLPGKRLGGDSRKFPLSSLRKATSSAAENRARKAIFLPSGPHKVGGDNSIKSALTPMQAAAMAAEGRFMDNIWCGSEVCIDLSEEEEHDENIEPLPKSSGNGCCSGISRPKDFDGQDLKLKSGKRKSDDASSIPSTDGQKKPVIVDLVGDIGCLDEEPPIKGRRKDSYKEALTSMSKCSRGQNDMWQCAACTLLNPPLAPICELCTNPKPKDENLKYVSWSCKFCTLENDMGMEKCSACETWRYSDGSPVASSAPNYGT